MTVIPICFTGQLNIRNPFHTEFTVKDDLPDERFQKTVILFT